MVPVRIDVLNSLVIPGVMLIFWFECSLYPLSMLKDTKFAEATIKYSSLAAG